MAKSNKDQRAARRRAARKQAAGEKAAARRAAGRLEAGQQPRGDEQAPGKQAPGKRAPRTAASAAAPGPGEGAPERLDGARKVAWWALLAMVFIVPIAMSNLSFIGIRPLTNDPFDLVKVSFERVLGLVALGAWTWGVLRRGGKVRRTPVDWLILAFLAWVALSTVTSISWPTALLGKSRRYEGLLSFANYAVIYFLVLQFAHEAARVRRLAQALFWSSVVVSAYGILQYAGHDPIAWGVLPFEAHRAFSTYGNPDLLGGFLIFSTTVALGLALFEQRQVWRAVYWVGFGLNGLTLIVAFTRGAWIGGAVSLAVLGVIAWRQRVRLRRVDWVPAAASIAVGAAVIWKSLSSSSAVMNFGTRLASIFQFQGGSGQTRAEIWQAAIRAIRERPVLGWGADTFRLVFVKFKPVDYVRDAGGANVADNAHDYPLQLASGVGIPGMLMFYGIFVWAGVRSFRTVFRHSGEASRIVVGAFWAAAVGYLVQLFFGISVTGVTFLLWAALGIVLAPTARLVTVKAPKWGTVVGAIVLALCALGIGYQAKLVLADHAFMRAQSLPTYSARLAAAREAVRLNPMDSSYREGLGLAAIAEIQNTLQAGAQAQQQGLDTAPYAAAVRQQFAHAEQMIKDAIALIPSEYDNYVSLAALYNLGGQTVDKGFYAEAIRAAKQGLAVEPYGTEIRVQLAQALQGTGQTAQAVKLLEYTLKIDPADGSAALPLAKFYALQGRVTAALDMLRAVDALRPGQPGVAAEIASLEASAAASP